MVRGQGRRGCVGCGRPARGAGVVLGREAPVRILCQHPQAGLHGRLRAPSARTGGDTDLRAEDVSGTAHYGAVPAPPLHPTRDLYEEFAESLSHADEVVLLPIYPAREEPIPGVTSELIARHVAVPCRIVGREALADTVAAMDTDVVVSFGAGNIDACCEALAEKLGEKS